MCNEINGKLKVIQRDHAARDHHECLFLVVVCSMTSDDDDAGRGKIVELVSVTHKSHKSTAGSQQRNAMMMMKAVCDTAAMQ